MFNPRFLVASVVAVAAAGIVAPAIAADHADGAAAPAPAAATVSLPTQAKSGTKAELDSLRTQSALEAERQKLADIRAKAGGAVGMGGPQVPAYDGRPIAVVPGGAKAARSDVSMRVTMVAGSAEQPAAMLQNSDGGQALVHVGDRLPGLGTVRSITRQQVVVADGKRTTSIPFAAEPVSSAMQGEAAAAAPMPFGLR